MLPTPFDRDGSRVDHDSLAALAAENIARGCSGLVALGVIGEPAALTSNEKLDVLRTLVTAHDVPVTATSMTTDPADRVEELSSFSSVLRAGDRVMVPVSTPDPAALRTRLVEAHEACGLPLVVQDYPQATGVRIDGDDLVDVVAGLPFVRAVKCEAQPTFVRIRELRARTAAIAMSGLGGAGLVDDLRAGATAVACGITRPEVVVDAVRLWEAGAGRAAAARVGTIAGLINFEIQQGTSIGIRKEHWRRQGVTATAAVRPPTRPFTPDLLPHSDAHCPTAVRPGGRTGGPS